MRIKLNIFILSAIIYFALPSVSDAAWEYITHGGYDAAVNAWKRTALIFSDNGYKGLFISAIVLGAVTIFAATYIRIATGAKAGGLSWAAPVLVGMAVYSAFIAPKDKLIIYDELLNRGPEEVEGIPLILATSAGMLNKIEKGFIDIVSTSSDPASDYRMNAGGIGWSLLDINPVNVLPSTQYSTLQRFIQDCVYMELVRNETILDINKIARGEQKWDTIIEESKNPVLYTVIYTSNGAGDPKTCSEAGDIVKNYITSFINNPDQEAIKMICASKGFNTTGASFNVCKNLITSILATTFFSSSQGSLDLEVFVAQKIMADAFMEVTTSKSSSIAISTLATSQTQSQFLGLGVHANNWIPVLKESLTAVAISITPLLLLFAATPLAGRALSLVFGMFVWLALWGIIDAVVHGFGMDLAKQASQTINTASGDMGLKAMLMWPEYTAKIAATFGALRWSGLMLASVISGMLIKFGGTALAMLAGSISGMPQSSGAAYGGTFLKQADKVVSGEIMPTQTWSNTAVVTGGVRELVSGLVQKQAGEMARGAMSGNQFEAARIAWAGFFQDVRQISSSLQLGSMQNAMNIGIAEGQRTLADYETKQSPVGFYKQILEKAGYRVGLSDSEKQKYKFMGFSEDEINNMDTQKTAYDIASLQARGINIQSLPDGRGARISTAGASMLVGSDKVWFDRFDDPGIKSGIETAVQRRAAVNALLDTDVGKKFVQDLASERFKGQRGSFTYELANSVRDAESKAVEKHIKTDSNLRNSLGFKESDEFFVSTTAEGNVGIKTPVASIQINTKTGIARRYNAEGQLVKEWNLSKGELEKLQSTMEKARTETIKNALVTESGFKELEKYAKSEKGEFEKAYKESWERAKTYTQTWGEDHTTALINKYIKEKYGTVNIDTVSKAQEDFARMRTLGNYEDFYKYTGISQIKPEEIDEKIEGIKKEVQGNFEGLKAKVESNTPEGVSGSPTEALSNKVERPDVDMEKEKKYFEGKYDKTDTKQREYFKEGAPLNTGRMFRNKAAREVDLDKKIQKQLPKTYEKINN